MKRDPSELECQTLSIPEAAQLLGISRSHAYRAAEAGELPTIRILGRVMVSRARLLAMIAGSPAEPVGGSASR